MTTIEMHQILIVKKPVSAIVAWCPACLEDVEVVTPEQAALLAGVDLREICRRIGADYIHIVETVNGGLICFKSLMK